MTNKIFKKQFLYHDVMILRHFKYEDEELFLVQGESGLYTVTRRDGEYRCTCPAYQYHKTCKHIDEVKAHAGSSV